MNKSIGTGRWAGVLAAGNEWLVKRQQSHPHVSAFAGTLRRKRVVSLPVLAGVGVAFVAALLALVFHINRPLPYIPYHDTWEYLHRAEVMLSGGPWVDAIRMPGYPLLLAGVFLVAGRGNLTAADHVQLLLFIVAAIEVYWLSYRLWRSTRFATIIGLLFASNFYFLSFFKALLSDGLAVVLALALALAILAFLECPRVGRFWTVTVWLLALIMTRAEWYLIPLLLIPYLLWVGYRRRRVLDLVPHMALALGLIYGVVFLYMELNARLNGYFGRSDAENINLYGKVTQYRMQGEAPARYAKIMVTTQHFVSRGITDPWGIYRHDPALGANNFNMMGSYARAIILRHPLAFVEHSIPLAFRSLYNMYAFANYRPAGRFAGALHAIEIFSAVVYPIFMLFPICAIVWVVLLWRWRHAPRRQQFVAEAVCALSLLAVYDLAVTTLASYNEYARLHMDFNPLMLAVVIGSIFLLAGARLRQPIADDEEIGEHRQQGERDARHHSLKLRPAAQHIGEYNESREDDAGIAAK